MKVKVIGLSVIILFGLILLFVSCSQQRADQGSFSTTDGQTTDSILLDTRIDEIWIDIIPEPGTTTAYGIPLSLDNTQQFIDWFYTIKLNENEKELKTEALSSLVAPCCDEYPVSEC